MFLRQIELLNFRNISRQEIVFSDRSNIFIGDNGQGKTNFLEAIYLLSHAKSFRTSDLSNLIAHGCDSAVVRGVVLDQLGQQTLESNLNRQARNRWLVNGKPTRGAGSFVRGFSSVSFTPDDLEIVRGAPAIRRELIDRYIIECWPANLQPINDYAQALKNKNALLKSEHPNREDIIHWNAVMAEAAVKIVQARRKFSALLRDSTQSFFSEFADNDGDLGFYWNETITAEGQALETENFRSQFNQRIDKELIVGASLVGPHRDDLVILLNGEPAKDFASQGQTRSIVLAIKLGLLPVIHRITDRQPVVILDDVDAELDAGRGERFFESIAPTERQIFVSATAISPALGALPTPQSIFRISSGQVVQN